MPEEQPSSKPVDTSRDDADIDFVTSRMRTDSGKRQSLDEVLDCFGVTREELKKLPD